MKKLVFSKSMHLLMIFWLTGGRLLCQNATDDIKVFKLSYSGQIGEGRASNYLPCYEPFYLKVKTDEIAGKKITQVKVWMYDSKGTSKTVIASAKTAATDIKTITFSSSDAITASLYDHYSGNTKSKMFSSVPSATNELLVYLDVNLNYKRYYYLEYEILVESSVTATAAVSGGGVTSIVPPVPGLDYISQPSVTIAGGNGNGAVATTVFSNGKVTSITVNQAGTGYTSPPTVTFCEVIHGEGRIYSTALKQDVTSLEAYTGLGLVFFGNPQHVSRIQANFSFVAGAKIHFRPVYSHPGRNRYSLYNWSRVSFTIGAALGKLNYANTEIKQLSDFVNPIFGFDIEPIEFVSIHLGTVLGMQESTFSSSTQKKMVCGFFFGLNLTPNVFSTATKNASGFKFPTGAAQP